MFAPRAFAVTDLTALDGLIAADAFVTLVTIEADGTPFASHLPVLYRHEGERVELEGHWARPNPQTGHHGPALAIVHGPHAYVSPGWYPDKLAASRVPTWNYAIAHLHGRLTVVEDDGGKIDHLTRFSRHFEQRAGGDWEFEPEVDAQRRQIRGLTAFRFVAERIELTFKHNQNHPAANQRAVADALHARGGGGERGVADLMRAHLRKSGND